MNNCLGFLWESKLNVLAESVDFVGNISWGFASAFLLKHRLLICYLQRVCYTLAAAQARKSFLIHFIMIINSCIIRNCNMFLIICDVDDVV